SSIERVLTLVGSKLDRKLGGFKAHFRQDRRRANTGTKLWSPTTGVADSSRRRKFGRLVCKPGVPGRDDCNVIIVDWSRGAKTLNYVFAAGNSALVGRQLSLLTQRLLKVYGLNASRVHCIGHSLGGHAAGFFGRHFKEKTGLLIGRISALDVAEPLFSDSGVSVCSEDAQFVDVIHTSEGHWYIRSGLGITKPVGHVDFYPNFGERQPGCLLM
ncbi:hypothetical protein HPB47_013131, partial [Ixodes persulcatus]